MNKLKTIDQHNEAVWKQMMEKSGTGVACPECDDGSEMIWVDDIVLASYPPQKNVICPVCNHKDRIYI